MIRLTALCLLAGIAHAQPPPKRYTCRRASSAIRIDGRLDDAAWRRAPWTARFVDIQGARQPRPRFRTRVKMLWDDAYLYVGAELAYPSPGTSDRSGALDRRRWIIRSHLSSN
jgi:Carbohydrate family 9 binding domain-like